MEPGKNAEIAMLLDFYGPLLTDRQREMLKCRVEEDLTLGEIAEDFSVSRQAVNDALKKAERTLLEMEDKLHLVKRYGLLHEEVARASEALENGDTKLAGTILQTMREEGFYGV